MATKTAKRKNSTPAQREGRYVFVGSIAKKVPAGVLACRRFAELPLWVRETPKPQRVFISWGRGSTDELIREALKAGRAPFGNLVTLKPPRLESVPALSGLFGRVIGAIAPYRWLPVAELASVFGTKDAADRFIGGAADREAETLALVRGNLDTLVVPFAFFQRSGDGTTPHFSKLSFADYGLTVALGDYETSADSILYEFDATYRRKLKKVRLKTEQSFGASLRRLRLQRGLKRSDFAPIASKTVARIERGDVARPHGRTLETIARRLRVAADQIESY